MQKLVADKEICQEAFKKGIKIESKFKWFKFSLRQDYILEFDPTDSFMCLSGELENKVPAYLTDEVLQKLPSRIVKDTYEDEAEFFLEIIKLDDDSFSASYKNEEHGFYYKVEDKKLSNALLSLAIKLFDEGILK